MRTDGSVSKVSKFGQAATRFGQTLILPTPPIRPILLFASTRLVPAGFALYCAVSPAVA
ncbi:hypothetical protein X740_23680 [Mesorhizobium sp. LNHC221B00]|nr:hypothetical protein X740_23680 [Mesorhizobium sp. LNHC221B00]